MNTSAPRRLPALLACVTLFASVCTAVHSTPPPAAAPSFAARIDALRDQLDTPEVTAILARADSLAASPILVRARSLDHMAATAANPAAGRTTDTRNKSDGLRRRNRPEDAEKFALASSDMGAARTLLEELPLLAAAWRLTTKPALREHLEKQLREVSTWTPFQRPGWTLSARKDPLPSAGDGVWLATGTLLQALAITLDILPQNPTATDALPSDLLVAVRQRMADEIRRTHHDWTARIPWYVQSQKVTSNQWVVPASGMFVAAAVLGRDQFPEAYQLGQDSLRRSLALAGDDGSLNEGHTYGMAWTSFSLLLARHYARQTGDTQFARQPFFQNFPNWMALYFQPGQNPVNAFDGFNAQRRNLAITDLTHLAAVSGSHAFAQTMLRETGRFRQNFFALLALGELASSSRSLPPPPPLPTAGLFQRSHMFIWRQSWAPDASGLWIRGGDAEDFHTHHDRGHINFIVSGTPILIESGTPGYANKRKRPDYDSTLGHNVLTLDGDTLPPHAPAPITVARHDATGGDLSIDLRKVYPALSDATRSATWTPATLRVTDTIATRPNAPAVTPAWRWHLATAEPARIEQLAPNRHRIKIPAGRIVFPAWVGPWQNPDLPRPQGEDILNTAAIELEITADAPITVQAITHPDHTLKFRRTENPHTTLVVSTPQPIQHLTLTTTLTATVP
ncbi:heparinase II/III domain-containing protein [Geminisphaera colitermitum]|uniref:heparinase II/III domain-containing protein n=1 Tax=Geminisphaera colitermitum TaxID=1148786 RepID=UPI000158C89F|nr:heparinase II/III family protein [Geminisphaera colitermitum]